MSRASTPALPVHETGLPTVRIKPSISSSLTSIYSLLSPSETADKLDSSLTAGLSSPDAHARLLKNGLNELPHEEPEPLWLRFLKQFKETLILLLLASAAISFFIGNRDDAISITLAVTIVVTVGFVQEYRSEQSLEALNKLVPHFAHVRRSNRSNVAREDRARDEIELEPYNMQTIESLDHQWQRFRQLNWWSVIWSASRQATGSQQTFVSYDAPT